jgi:DNA-binding Lrp family transcriptional regulator
MAKQRISMFDKIIRKMYEDRIPISKCYKLINIAYRANGLTDVLSYNTVRNRYKALRSEGVIQRPHSFIDEIPDPNNLLFARYFSPKGKQ